MTTSAILEHRITLLRIKQRLLELAGEGVTIATTKACIDVIQTINEALEALEQAQEEN